MDFPDVVRRRRMVRSFTADPVAPEALERVLDVARRGPSAGYSQGVEFILITHPELRAAVAGREPDSVRAAGVGDFAAQAPALVIVCASAEIYRSRYREPDKSHLRTGRDDDFWLVPYWHTDAGAALMLVLLAAVNEGLGAGVAGVMGPRGQERVRRATGMPSSYTAVAIVALGHEAADAGQLRGSAATRKRRPLADVVHRDRW